MNRFVGSWLRFALTLTAFHIGVLGVAGYALWLLRADALSHHFRISALLARSFEGFITQSIDATTLAAGHVVSTDTKSFDACQIESSFALILRNAPHLRSLSLIDDTGRILVSSNPANVGLSLSGEAYYPVSDATYPVLHIGVPWSGRDFSEGRPDTPDSGLRYPAAHASTFLPLTLGLPSSSRALTLLVALNTDYFLNHIARQLDPQLDIVEVLRLDGVLLFSTAPKSAIETHSLFALMQPDQREYGQFVVFHPQLGQSLAAFRVSSLFPFVVVSRVPQNVALRQWRTEATTILGILVPVLVLLSFLSTGYYRRHLLLQEERAESERLHRVNASCVFTNTREGIAITDANGIILDVNDAFTHITGYTREDALGKTHSILRSGYHDKAFYDAMWHDLRTQGHWGGEVWNRRKDGEVYAEMLTISAAVDSQGQVQQYVAVFRNITAIKNYQTELERTARHDALTQLPNRILLADRLGQAMAQMQRREECLAVAFIDLDGFKAINDIHGHHAGDQVLIAVATRMRDALRDGDTLARNGGDEFVAVLVDLQDPSDVLPLLERLLQAVAQPIPLDGTLLSVTASIGVSFLCRSRSTTAEELLHEADIAMYQAKLAGKHRYHVFGPTDIEPRTSISASTSASTAD
ncbi:diguanylate cyclase domain-containing protein [Candidatus Symbiobacter mobilis]|uniref:GGDEF domain protein n=1 Tax=Candidatus Symbiobacter mobilis CR TaxID=946483 RepID=U5NB20_9BURK|nr:diguanylate cyclase [Candidatus Symbiobacter mobilis]AGX88510.1 GGDEF domain protein [Candidatus Symbiobacter mobilis CR]